MSCTALQQILEVPDKNDCFSNSSSANENGKKFAVENRAGRNICRVRVDDCLITSREIKKCDYLFAVIETSRYYLVELKGTAVADAVAQIVSTFDIVNRKIRETPQNYKGVIVSSAVPSATEQRFRKLQDKCFRDKKLRIVKTHIQHTERI